MTSIKEKQVEKMLDKLIGSGDETLRIITKLALTNTELTPEIINTINYLKKQNEEIANALNQELEMTLDVSGNPIPLEQKITFTVTETSSEDVVDCGGNVVFRLPVGNT